MRFIQTGLMSRPSYGLLSRRYDSSSKSGGVARRAPLAAVALAIALTAAACSSGGSGSTSTTALPHVNASLTVAVVPGIDTAPLFIAKNDGTFAQAGLQVTIETVPSANAALAAVQQGKADIAVSDYVTFFQVEAAAKKPDLRIVADAYDCASGVMEVLTTPKSNITQPQQLAGRTIGISAVQGITTGKTISAGPNSTPFSPESMITLNSLTADNVDTASTKWLPLPTTGLIQALQSHRVSAIVVQEPQIYQAETRLGAVPILDSCSGLTTGMPLDGYFTSNAVVASNTPALNAFQAILQQEGATAVQQMGVRDQLAKPPTNLGAQAAAVVTLGTYPTTLNAAVLNNILNQMITTNMIPGGLSQSVQSLLIP